MAAERLIVGLGGTLRERSLSRAALAESLRVARERGATTELLDLRELALPMYVPDRRVEDYADEAGRKGIARLVDACRRASAFIWSSPCYHGTVAGVFKNALDHLELLGEDPAPYLAGKPVGLVAINDGKTFGAMSNSVHELRAWLAPTHVLLGKADFDATPAVSSDSGRRRLARQVDELLGFRPRA